jgi:biotin carboxylase
MRVLVVGTNRACHHRLSRRGHELVLVMPRGKAGPEDLAGPYRHVLVIDDDAPLDLWVEVARACHRTEPFDAVVAFNEGTYRIVDAVSRRLGIPSTVDVELFDRVLDKVRTREILAGAGIPSCRYEHARGRDATIAAVDRIGLPCVVKPVDGEGSLGVARIAVPADVEPALRWVGDDRLDLGVLVEEYLTGEETSVETVSTRDHHHVIAVTKKYKHDRTFVEQGHLVSAPVSPVVRAAIAEYVVRVLDALGFHDCPSHTELMLTADGPVLIETHNRIGGDRIMDLIEHATGLDMYDLVARQSLGEDVSAQLSDALPPQRYAAVWYADPGGSPDQRLHEVAGVDAARSLPGVMTVDVLRGPGSRPGKVRTSFDRSALAVAVGDTPDEAVDRARRAARSLTFTYVWDPSDA